MIFTFINYIFFKTSLFPQLITNIADKFTKAFPLLEQLELKHALIDFDLLQFYAKNLKHIKLIEVYNTNSNNISESNLKTINPNLKVKFLYELVSQKKINKN